MPESRYAVLIGCNNYPKDPPKLPALRCAEKDAQGFRDVLVDKEIGGFVPDNIYLFTNEPNHEILTSMARTLGQAEKDDLVIVYFSGHGKLDQNNRLHLATANTETDILGVTSIPITRITDLVDESRSEKVLLILDCCYSGAVGAAFKGGDVDSELQVAAGGKGKYIMTASTGIEVAEEKEGEDNSLFTKHLLEGLQTGDADLDANGEITVDELYDYAREKVLQGGKQEPMKFVMGVTRELVIAGARQPKKLRLRCLVQLLTDQQLTREEYNFAVSVVNRDGPLSAEQTTLIELVDGISAGDDPEGCATFIRMSRNNEIAAQKRELKDKAEDFRDGDMYEEAFDIWKQVLNLDPNDGEAIRESEELNKIMQMRQNIQNYADSAEQDFAEGRYLDSMGGWIEILRLDAESQRATSGLERNMEKMKEAATSSKAERNGHAGQT